MGLISHVIHCKVPVTILISRWPSKIHYRLLNIWLSHLRGFLPLRIWWHNIQVAWIMLLSHSARFLLEHSDVGGLLCYLSGRTWLLADCMDTRGGTALFTLQLERRAKRMINGMSQIWCCGIWPHVTSLGGLRSCRRSDGLLRTAFGPWMLTVARRPFFETWRCCCSSLKPAKALPPQ
jgi:hypothetical protein